MSLIDELAADETPLDAIQLLGAGNREKVKEAKEWKEAAKAHRTSLSPRSQQLREAAVQRELARKAEQERRWKEEEETGRRWTAAKWLGSRGVAQHVADALALPADANQLDGRLPRRQ